MCLLICFPSIAANKTPDSLGAAQQVVPPQFKNLNFDDGATDWVATGTGGGYSTTEYHSAPRCGMANLKAPGGSIKQENVSCFIPAGSTAKVRAYIKMPKEGSASKKIFDLRAGGLDETGTNGTFYSGAWNEGARPGPYPDWTLVEWDLFLVNADLDTHSMYLMFCGQDGPGGYADDRPVYIDDIQIHFIPPHINSVSPSNVSVGNSLTIEGSGFDHSQGSSSVTIGGVVATGIESWGETEIKVVVPSGVSSGVADVIVTTAEGASNAVAVTVTGDKPPPPGYLSNPSFETGGADWPNGEGPQDWQSPGEAAQNYTYWSDEKAYEGSKSVKMLLRSWGGVVERTIPMPIQSGQEISVKAWVNMPQPGNQSNKWFTLYILAYDSGGELVAYQATSQYDALVGWQQLEAKAIASGDVSSITIRAHTQNGNGSYQGYDKAVWVDQFSLAVDGQDVPDVPTFYFAEGATHTNFEEWISIQNPGDETANVQIDYMLEDEPKKVQTLDVGPTSRSTVSVNGFVGQDKNVSAIVKSTNGVRIIAERPMYFNYQRQKVTPKFENLNFDYGEIDWQLIANGGYETAEVHSAPRAGVVNMQAPGGSIKQEASCYLPAGTTAKVSAYVKMPQGGSIDNKVFDLRAGGLDKTGTQATFYSGAWDQGGDRPGPYPDWTLVEWDLFLVNPSLDTHSMYIQFCTQDGPGGYPDSRPVYIDDVQVSFAIPGDFQEYWPGGHSVVGATNLSRQWYFGEGTVRDGFNEWISLMNPSGVDATATLTFMTGTGENIAHQVGLPAESRQTVFVNEVVNVEPGPAQDVATTVDATIPIIAERSMYFNYAGKWTGGHCCMGAISDGLDWYFAEGNTYNNFDQYISILNFNEQDAKVTITYMPKTGKNTQQSLDVPKKSRQTVVVRDFVGADEEVSCLVQSTNSVGIIAERPMYFNYKEKWAGGHVVMGARGVCAEWFFAEGTTRSDFEEWICVQNPSSETADVEITYMLDTGETKVEAFNMGPNTRETKSVNAFVGPGADVSCVINTTNGVDIVVERPMYFNYKGIWPGGHCVVGFTD